MRAILPKLKLAVKRQRKFHQITGQLWTGEVDEGILP
jgi:hypothetical protein